MTPETDEKGNVSAAPAARARKDNLWAGLATTVAVASMLWIAYQSTVRNEVTLLQRRIEAQHAELQSLKGKIQEMAATQSQTDVAPSISEIQGLQNHVNTLRGQQKQRKK
jgi:cell division protein FtsL